MKKALFVLLAITLLFTFTACKSADTADNALEITEYYVDGTLEVHRLTYCTLDDGSYTYTLEYTAPEGKSVSIFNPPNGTAFLYLADEITSGQQEALTFELTADEMSAAFEDGITVNFYSENDSEMNAVFFRVEP